MRPKRRSERLAPAGSPDTFGEFKPPVVNALLPRETFLIVCEGAKTEPHYFNGFKLSSAQVRGLGRNTVDLVEAAIRLKENEFSGYDHYWCVFDRDSFPRQNFNLAITRARENGFEVAYSNEAFELWYLLHFDYHDAAISRALYKEKLTAKLGYKYEKNLPTIYDDLFSRQSAAIRNAERLLSNYQPPWPERDNPSTTVHKLVEKLNEQLAR
jgi:hypothetical protein